MIPAARGKTGSWRVSTASCAMNYLTARYSFRWPKPRRAWKGNSTMRDARTAAYIVCPLPPLQKAGGRSSRQSSCLSDQKTYILTKKPTSPAVHTTGEGHLVKNSERFSRRVMPNCVFVQVDDLGDGQKYNFLIIVKNSTIGQDYLPRVCQPASARRCIAGSYWANVAALASSKLRRRGARPWGDVIRIWPCSIRT